MYMWDLMHGRIMNVFEGHSRKVWSVAFNHNGHLLASGSDDGTIKLWEVPTGACLHTMRSDRPYEHMNITGATGLTNNQLTTLKILGAYEKEI